MCVARKVVLHERELISKRVSGSHADREKVQESINEEPKVGLSFQFKFEKGYYGN